MAARAKEWAVKTAPGFGACLVLGLLAQAIAKLAPAVGAALFAIALGMVCGNTFLNRPAFDEGSKFSERSLLEYSIVLTGGTLVLSDILALGLGGVAFILCQMALTVTAAYLIGRRFGFGRRFCLLMGAGNAVCGSSAIATVSPVVGANSKDKGISITIVNVTGTVLMVLLPLVTGLVYGHAMLPTTAMIGGVMQSIGQVIAAAGLVGAEYVPGATIFKIVRIVFIVLVALAFSRLNHEEEGSLFAGKGGAAGVKAGVPWFIIGFFVLAGLNTLGLVPAQMSAAAKFVSGHFEIIALAAIGMRVKFRDLVREGPRALSYGLLVGGCQVLFALGLIRLLLG